MGWSRTVKVRHACRIHARRTAGVYNRTMQIHCIQGDSWQAVTLEQGM